MSALNETPAKFQMENEIDRFGQDFGAFEVYLYYSFQIENAGISLGIKLKFY